jgi:MFS family permease
LTGQSLEQNNPNRRDGHSILAPFGHPVFVRIWLASLASNFGILIQGVGAAWAMTQLTPSPHMVGLVQTASFLPFLLLSLLSGAVADMFDRRIVGIAGLAISFLAATLLSVFASFGLLSPRSLLVFSFVIGAGVAIFAPAWLASVSEQVPAPLLPQAISLNSISFNIARAFGPALGGMLVAAGGAVSAFVTNATLYIPMIAVLATWRRERLSPRLPPEGLAGAMVSGLRYIIHSPMIRVVLVRTVVLATIGGAVPALIPLVARDILSGGAVTYGVLLGAFGVGAIFGALCMSEVRNRFDSEQVLKVTTILLGFTVLVVSLSTSTALSIGALLLNGAAWMTAMASLNIEVQLAAPRWISGRTLAMFQASAAGGIAAAGLVWGQAAESTDVRTALMGSGVAMFASLLLTLWLRVAGTQFAVEDPADAPNHPDVAMELSPRSGPIVVTIEFRVAPNDARRFYQASQNVARIRQRNGAYGWSIAREISDPDLWTERFHCPTWADYLRQRSRSTMQELQHQKEMLAFHTGADPPRVRRMLERPFGSVRWRDDTPDIAADAPTPPSVPGAL